MSEYKVMRVSESPPREVFSQQFNSTTYYIKVLLEGHRKPVSIGKKRPDALKTGDSVYGTIVPTDYEADNFKPESPKPYVPGGTPKDDAAIKAMWAVGQAINWLNGGHDVDKAETIGDIEPLAKDLFSMVDRVKTSPAPVTQASTTDTAGRTPDKVYTDFDPNEPVSLNDQNF